MPPLSIESGQTAPTPQERRVGWYKRQEVRVTLIYMLAGSLWIIASDAALNVIVHGHYDPVLVNALKGLYFVFTSGLLLFLVLRRSFGGWRKSERLRIEHALAARSRFQRLSHRIENLREAERTRISHEIHDELGQMLTGLKMRSRLIENRLAATDNRAMNPLIDELVEASVMIDESIAAIRRISSGLRPASLDHLGLAAAISEEAAQFTRISGIPCNVSLTSMDRKIPSEIETSAFRILQESLTNVSRHAKAHEVVVTCSIHDGVLDLTVSDDGIGMTQNNRQEPFDSLGLLGMHERADEIGGKLTVESEQGRGTKVLLRVCVPTERESPLPAAP